MSRSGYYSALADPGAGKRSGIFAVMRRLSAGEISRLDATSELAQLGASVPVIPTLLRIAEARRQIAKVEEIAHEYTPCIECGQVDGDHVGDCLGNN